MKLGLLVPGGFDPSDRVIPALSDLAAELAGRHDVHVFVTDGPSGPVRYRRSGAMVYQLARSLAPTHRRSRARRAFQTGRFLTQLFRAMHSAQSTGAFDLLHAFWASDTGLAATLIARRLHVPVVVSVGGGEAVWLADIHYGGGGSRIGRARTRAALRLANIVTAGSVFAARLLPGDAFERTRIVPLGVRCEAFAAPPARAPGPPWRLLHVADLNLVKDHTTLLESFRQIVARLGDVSLDCVGHDTLGGQLQRRAEALGIAARVRFHGFMPQKMLPEFYRSAHLHVQSSRYESQGVAILEAAAAGLPTIGTAVGILPTMAPLAARCVRPGDADALAEAVLALLLDPSARETMGAAAQQWALDHDAAWTAREFESIYGSLLG